MIHATADAGVYDSDARALYDALAAPDKTLEFIKADHYLTEPDGARTQAADLIAAWASDRLEHPVRAGPLRPHLMPMPPSEWTTVPVIPRARSEARNT